MKKLLYVLLAMTLVFAATACGQKADTDNADSNSNPAETLPSAEATQEQITEEFGFEMTAPENSKNAEWAVVDECIGQLTFELDGQSVCFRMTTDAAPSEETEALEMLKTVSGINEELAETESGKVGDMNAFVFFNSGKSGAVIWYSEDGTIYTVTVDKKASADKLLELAEQLNRPVTE